jgi:hypothetical protein
LFLIDAPLDRFGKAKGEKKQETTSENNNDVVTLVYAKSTQSSYFSETGPNPVSSYVFVPRVLLTAGTYTCLYRPVLTVIQTSCGSRGLVSVCVTLRSDSTLATAVCPCDIWSKINQFGVSSGTDGTAGASSVGKGLGATASSDGVAAAAFGDLVCSRFFISSTSTSELWRSFSWNVNASDRLTARNVFGSFTLVAA